jgi:nucleotide-binding universal stress UspA family protein
MEKILFAIDAVNIDMTALDFACYIGRLTHSKITGVFLENLVSREEVVVKAIHSGVEEGSDFFYESYDKAMVIEKNIAFFKEACENRSLKYNIHRDRGVPAQEIIQESRYADLIIVDAATSFRKTHEGAPSEFVKDMLREAECPVIIAPESFNGIDEIVFTYNGSKSSVFAIKQFTYLFPELDDKKIMVLQINKEGLWAHPDKYNFKEWMRNHYSSVGFEVLKGDTDDKLFDYLFKRKNVFIVMGAYGRSAISRFFQGSHADMIIKTVTQPVFIAHY